MRRAKHVVPANTTCANPACGEIATEAHHIKPLMLGGEDVPENLEYLCRDCHVLVHKWDNTFRVAGHYGGVIAALKGGWRTQPRENGRFASK